MALIFFKQKWYLHLSVPHYLNLYAYVSIGAGLVKDTVQILPAKEEHQIYTSDILKP